MLSMKPQFSIGSENPIPEAVDPGLRGSVRREGRRDDGAEAGLAGRSDDVRPYRGLLLAVEGRPDRPAGGSTARMTPNQRTVERYSDGFRTMDRALILSCLTEDVEWVIPGLFHVHGKEDFAKHIVDEGFADTPPTITVDRLLEAGDVVVAEGAVRAPKQGGTFLDLAFCDVFDMRNGKIRRLASYLAEAK